MTVKARIFLTSKKAVLDPAGEAVKKILLTQQLLAAREVRIGKVIDITLNSDIEITTQLERIKKAVDVFLRNPITEDVSIEILNESEDEQ